MKKFKSFNFFFTLIYRLFYYGVCLYPIASYLTLLSTYSSNDKFLYFFLACFQSLLLLIFIPPIISFFLPKLKPGIYDVGSKEFYLCLTHEAIREVQSSSSFLSGIINRVEFLRLLVFYLYGSKVKGYFSLSYNTKLLSPQLMTFYENSYIAFDTLVSCHLIQGSKIWIFPFSIGKRSAIGADCKISCGVSIGDYSFLDTGVHVSARVKIGDNVKILNYSNINNNTVIGNKSVIGKYVMIDNNVTIGEKSIINAVTRIEDNVKIGNRVTIGKNCVIRNGSVIEDGAKIPDCAFIDCNSIIKNDT